MGPCDAYDGKCTTNTPGAVLISLSILNVLNEGESVWLVPRASGNRTDAFRDRALSAFFFVPNMTQNCSRAFSLQNLTVVSLKGVGDVLAERVEQGNVKVGEKTFFLPAHAVSNPCTGKFVTIGWGRQDLYWYTSFLHPETSTLRYSDKKRKTARDWDPRTHEEKQPGGPRTHDKRIRHIASQGGEVRVVERSSASGCVFP